MTSLSESIAKLGRLSDGKTAVRKYEVFEPIQREIKVNDFELTKELFWKLFKFHSNGNYKINKHNEKVVYTILRYFLKQEDFNEFQLIKTEPSLDKGILVHGDNGVGKSFLFNTIHKVGKELVEKRDFKDLWFPKVTARKFVEDFMESTKNEDSTFKLSNYHKGDLYIDDLGFEDLAFNKTEVFSGVLFERDRNKAKTHVSTNSKPSELAKRYGRQVADRLPQMFNIIKWEGESFRK